MKKCFVFIVVAVILFATAFPAFAGQELETRDAVGMSLVGLNTLDLYPKDAMETTQLLFVNFGEKETAYCLPMAAKCREAGIRCEVFPDKAKMKKQMSYANAKAIPFVALAGDNEMAEGKITLKDMNSGEQQMVDPQQLIQLVRK